MDDAVRHCTVYSSSILVLLLDDETRASTADEDLTLSFSAVARAER